MPWLSPCSCSTGSTDSTSILVSSWTDHIAPPSERQAAASEAFHCAHRALVRRAAGRAVRKTLLVWARGQSMPAALVNLALPIAADRSPLAQVFEGREAELPSLGQSCQESGLGGHQDAQSPQPMVEGSSHVQAESASGSILHQRSTGKTMEPQIRREQNWDPWAPYATRTIGPQHHSRCADNPKPHRISKRLSSLNSLRRNWRTCPRMVLRSTPWHKVSASSSPRRPDGRGEGGKFGVSNFAGSLELRLRDLSGLCIHADASLSSGPPVRQDPEGQEARGATGPHGRASGKERSFELFEGAVFVGP